MKDAVLTVTVHKDTLVKTRAAEMCQLEKQGDVLPDASSVPVMRLLIAMTMEFVTAPMFLFIDVHLINSVCRTKILGL